MAKTKTKSRSNSKDILRSTNSSLIKSGMSLLNNKSTENLLLEAGDLLEQSEPEKALTLIQEALKRLSADTKAYADVDTMLQAAAQDKATYPTALNLAADINLALGDIDSARTQFEEAVKIDSNGALISAEPYLQLAQLCEQGGQESINYFEKAIQVMRNEIEVLDEQMDIQGTQEIVDSRRSKVADALCGMAEVYMTDLSWEDDAEQRADQLVTEAVATCPEALSAGVLQTLASVRISQERYDEAKNILTQSLALWKDLPLDIETPARPDFAARVSLVRLLMEVEREQEAFTILENLVKEDDQSVEALYLGGWCQMLIMQKLGHTQLIETAQAESTREWLLNALKLYKTIDYQDEPLKEHAEQLVRQLNEILGIQGNDDDEWDDVSDKDDKDDDDGDIEADDDDVEMT